jgi:uncharacterized protein (DUF2267 family)
MKFPVHPESVEFAGLVMGREAVAVPLRLPTCCEVVHSGKQAALAAPVAPTAQPIKDHQIAETVNALRDVAVQFHDAQQLRERIAGIVVPLLSALPARTLTPVAAQPQEPVAQWQKKHPGKTTWDNTDEHDAKWWSANSQGWEIRALYTHPAAAQPVTDAEVNEFFSRIDMQGNYLPDKDVRAALEAFLASRVKP